MRSPQTLGMVIATLAVFFAPLAHADHQGPDRVIEGKYAIMLSMQPGKDGTTMTFFFRNVRTGKLLTGSFTGSLLITDPKTTAVVASDVPLSVTNGKGTVFVEFPRDGVYMVRLGFLADGSVYSPEPWDVWLPGKEAGDRPAHGLSEWMGLGIFGTAIALVGGNLLHKRRKRSRM